MRILVIGSDGQVGRSMLNILDSKGIDYVALNKSDLDITDKDKVYTFFANNHCFDYVVNCAAYTAVDRAETEPDKAHDVNCSAIESIALQCAKFNIPIIHLSTDYVFDGSKLSAYNEVDTPGPLTVYGKTKLLGEEVLKKSHSKYIILRVSWVFSAYRNNFLKSMLSLSRTKKKLSVVADQCGGPTSARSIAKTIMQICCRLKQYNGKDIPWGIYHYSNGPATSWHQFAVCIIDKYKSIADNVVIEKVEPITSNEYNTLAQRPKNSVLDTSRIREIFAVEPCSWVDEIEHLIFEKRVM